MIRRSLPWLVLAVGLLLIAAISTFSEGQSTRPPLDSASARADGGLASHLWLERIGRSVAVDGGLSVRTFPPSGTLLLLSPQPALSHAQVRQILDWTERGGWTVVATEGDSAATLVATLGETIVPGGGAVHVVQPLLLAPPVRRLAGGAAAVVSGRRKGTPVVSAASGPVLLYRPWGHGAVWLLTTRSVLDNQHLPLADNRRLLLDLVGPHRPVIFEEYRGPTTTPDSGWLTTTAWGAAFLFALAILLLYLWSSGRRLGPPLPAPEEEPRVTAEYVTSLASLLQEAQRRGDILRIYQADLRRAIIERYGDMNAVESERRAEAERLMAPADELSEGDLRERVAAIVEYEDEIRRARV